MSVPGSSRTGPIFPPHELRRLHPFRHAVARQRRIFNPRPVVDVSGRRPVIDDRSSHITGKIPWFRTSINSRRSTLHAATPAFWRRRDEYRKIRRIQAAGCE
jgi:hypothetical protein